MIGKALAHYDITSQLGKRGMGRCSRRRTRRSDGRQFLRMKQTVSTAGASSTHPPRVTKVILSWLEELKKRVPIK